MPSLQASPAPGSSSDAVASNFSTSYAGVVTFIAVATEGSFARASDRLGVGRSAVSRSVQKLEANLGTRLFHRTTRATSLTAEGELFFANCRPGVEQLAQALDNMRELRQGPVRGHLRVGSTVGFGRKVVAPLLKGFRQSYPDVHIDLVLDDSLNDFTQDGIDLSFRNGRLEDSQIIARQMIPMQMLVCASPAYALANGLPGTIEEIAEHRCINFRLASGRMYEWEFKAGGITQKLLPGALYTFNDADLVLQAVLDGQGIAQMAAYQVCDLLRSGDLVACLLQHAPDDSGHYLCYQSRQHLPERMRVFIDYMAAGIRALDLSCAADCTG